MAINYISEFAHEKGMGPFSDQNFKNQVSDHSEGWQNIRKQISKIPEGGFPGYTKGNQWSTMAAFLLDIYDNWGPSKSIRGGDEQAAKNRGFQGARDDFLNESQIKNKAMLTEDYLRSRIKKLLIKKGYK